MRRARAERIARAIAASALACALALVFAHPVRAQNSFLLIDDSPSDVARFELFQGGLFWWEPLGSCGEIQNVGTIRVRNARHWGPIRYVATDCLLHTGGNSSVVRDGTSIYFWYDGVLSRRGVSAPAIVPHSSVDSPPITVPQLSSPLALHGGTLYWAEFVGNGYAIRSIATDGSGSPALVFSALGQDVEKLEVVDYIDPNGDPQTALLVLSANGGLRRKRLTGDLADHLMAVDVRDFAVHTLGGIPSIALPVTSVYVAKGERVVLPSSSPGKVQRYDIHTSANELLYQAGGNDPIVSITTDSFQPRTLATIEPRNLYFAEALYTCVDFFCVSTIHHIHRQALNVASPLDETIQVTGKPTNLRSDDYFLYFSKPDAGAIKLYWMSTDAPAITIDFEALGVEMVQNTQSLWPPNQLLMIPGKRTWARGYGRIAQNSTSITTFSLSADLHVERNGNPIPGSPFRSKVNGNLNSLVDLASGRNSLLFSWFFEIPQEQLFSGSYDLTFVLDGDQTSQETGATANNSVTTIAGVQTKGRPCLIYKPIEVQNGYTYYGGDHVVEPIERRATSLLPVRGFRHWFDPTALDKIVFHKEWVPCFPLVCVIIVPGTGPFIFTEEEEDGQEAIDHLRAWSNLHNDPPACNDKHYVGMVTPVAQDFNGIGSKPGRNVVVRMEPGGSTPHGTPLGGLSLAHELGHNYDRDHIDQTTSPLQCGGGSPDDADPSPPFDTCTFSPDLDPNLLTTHFGFDPINGAPIAPTMAADIMSYAPSKWISKYTYDAIHAQITTEGSGLAMSLAGGALIGPQLYLAGSLDPVTDEVTMITSLALAEGEYSNTPAQRSHDQAAAETGVYEWVLRDADASEIARTKVTVEILHETPLLPYGFAQYIDWPGGVTRLELQKSGLPIFQRALSSSAPTLALGSPVVDAQNQSLALDWTASDADGDVLRFTVQYSADGLFWSTLVNGTVGFGTALSTRRLAGSASAQLRVFASDGLRTSSALTPPFAVPDHDPVASITGIGEGEIVPFGRSLELYGSASDSEDGPILDAALAWSLDGNPVATGDFLQLSEPLPGSYTVELEATDSDARQGSDTRSFEVAPVTVPETTAPFFDGNCDDPVYRDGTRLSIPILGGGEASVRMVHAGGKLFACFIDLLFDSDSIPPTIVGIAVDTLGDRGTVVGADDWGFFVDQDGATFERRGTSAQFPEAEPPALGFDAYVQRGGGPPNVATGNWRAELRIDDALLGGWNHSASLAVVHDRNASGLDDDNWPAWTTLLVPDTWAAAWLGASAPAPANRLPVAEVGPDQIVAPLVPKSVYLDGQASHDPDGDALSFAWQQTAGPSMFLHDATSATPRFGAHPVSVQTDLVFQLVVSDAGGSSAPVESRVTLFPIAQPPLPTPDPGTAAPPFSVVAAPGNAADPETGWGSVASIYEAGTYEITNMDYVAFLNAVAGSDAHELYHPSMTDDPRGGILRMGAPGAYLYDTKPYMAVMPVNFVSWLDAARYVNWLENGKPVTSEDAATEGGSYDLTIGSAGQFAARQPGATYVLGSLDEWYKAAYHEPVSANYWIYPTDVTEAPTRATATPHGGTANPGPGIANDALAAFWNAVAGNVLAVTSASAPSPHGTLDQGGNVAEWIETSQVGPTGASRIVRGGSYASDDAPLSSPINVLTPFDYHSPEIGFRVFRLGSGDWDGDDRADAADNCPLVNNPGQETNPDGTIGAACLCGDADDSGAVDGGDVDEIRAALAAQIPAVAAPSKCKVSAADQCDVVTSVILRRSTAGLSPAPQQVCAAALP